MMKNYNLHKIIAASQIQRQIKEYAQKLNARYQDQNLTLIVVMRGAFYFAADLTRYLSQKIKLQIFFLTYKTYSGQQKNGLHRATNNLTEQLKQLPKNSANHHFLVLDDILDTGQTIVDLEEHLKEFKTLSLYFAVLIKNQTNDQKHKTLMKTKKIAIEHLFS